MEDVCLTYCKTIDLCNRCDLIIKIITPFMQLSYIHFTIAVAMHAIIIHCVQRVSLRLIINIILVPNHT